MRNKEAVNEHESEINQERIGIIIDRQIFVMSQVKARRYYVHEWKIWNGASIVGPLALNWLVPWSIEMQDGPFLPNDSKPIRMGG